MSGLIPDGDAVTRTLLERNAALRPNEVFVTFEDGTAWTRAQGLVEAYRVGNSLREAGISQGDTVALFLPNGPDFLRAWWGTAVIGATILPVNIHHRGLILANLLKLSRSAALIADARGHDIVRALDDDSIAIPLRLDSRDLQSSDARAPELAQPLGPWDKAALMMTSGTTGASKLAVNTYRHLQFAGSAFPASVGADPTDVYHVDLPLFHGAALWATVGCLISGARMVVREVPDLRHYWEVARDNDITIVHLMSSMIPFLQKQPPRAADRGHRIRAFIAIPVPKGIKEFQVRFGIPNGWSSWGTTEAPYAMGLASGEMLRPGYLGQLREGFEVRLVDRNDMDVAPGHPGEAIVRTTEPWIITPEYVNNAEATAVAWRNGWYHTGDLLKQAGDGFYFVDRLKDSIRRRGENVSSAEVEAELRVHPMISEVACVPYRDADTVEDEVKVWVVPAEGQDEIDFEELLRYSASRMAHFMVPRYFEQTAELPKTTSGRVEKYKLRDIGNSEATWDREEHGFRVVRHGLVTDFPTAT
jgi:crotonobetaine/carnitine-CoA ligase